MKEDYKDRIVTILEDHDIEWWPPGAKNVTEGCVNVQCCFCDDHSNHLGIFVDSLFTNCWRCGQRSHFTFVLSTLLRIPISHAQGLIEDSDVSLKGQLEDTIEAIFWDDLNEEEKEKFTGEIPFPENYEAITRNTKSGMLEKYMGRRNLRRKLLIEKCCGIIRGGKGMNRMVIPVFSGGKLVAYQGADMTGTSYLKYKTSTGSINEFLYDYDRIDKRMILTEGVLDAWRVYEDSVCTFGTSLTRTQKQMIIAKKLDTLVFCWDGDAYWKAAREAEYFYPFIENVFVVALPDGQDPDSFGHEETWRLINEECNY